MDGFDLGAELLELGLVFLVVRLLFLGLPVDGREDVGYNMSNLPQCLVRRDVYLPVNIDVPVMLGRHRPHRLQKVALCIVALFSGRLGVIDRGGLGQAR